MENDRGKVTKQGRAQAVSPVRAEDNQTNLTHICRSVLTKQISLEGPDSLPSCWTHWPRTESIREAAAWPASKKPERKNTAKPKANQMMVFLLVSPLDQHQAHPRRSSYKNIIHKIRRQGGRGGTEGVIDIISPTDRCPHLCHPPPETGLRLYLLGWLVGWLACLSW